MDSVRGAEAAADLVNSDLGTPEGVADSLDDRGVSRATALGLDEKDLRTLRRFQRDLRGAFERGSEDDEDGVVDTLNDLLVRHPVVPVIAACDARLHLQAHDGSGNAVRHVVASSLLALATLACEQGPSRLGVCGATRCDNVFVDTSPNASRRYCSDRCSSRANVAAYRARQKAARRAEREAEATARGAGPSRSQANTA